MVNNKLFYIVYAKAVAINRKQADQIMNHYHFGSDLPSKKNILQMNNIMEYLNLVKNSVYTYEYVQGLTEISNKLNLL